MTVRRYETFKDRRSLVDTIVDVCTDVLEVALRTRGTARMALSGGTTPEPLYRALAEQDLGWGHVDLALVDERWVGSDHEASNERLVRRSFAQPLESGARLTYMKTRHPTPGEAQPAVERRYAALRPFDLVVLGMGADGHTASWFPGCDGLADALDPPDGRAVTVVRAPARSLAAPYVERMTMTRPVIAEAGRVVLMITGADKRAAFARARDEGPEAEAPVRALLHRADAAVDVYWAP